MPSRPYVPPRPAARRWRVLCVLGLLAGLLGMHGLGPVAAAPSSAHDHRMSVVAKAHAHCPDGDCGGSGHVHHADPTCASAALHGPPAPPALTPSLGSPVQPSEAAGAGEPVNRDGGRAPPSLAELQLLRI
ncbi:MULTISPECIES: DUF6153 family protein [Streptomyces]|uniref:DUF6153 family protein n=1 Tax=Streptomyces nigrescens TaxID=1920 RepID=A0ABY7JGN9_STRNI|nr:MULTISPECIES: DUF6153 family protein [Streptomyces]AWN28555.1 hypothetical protein DKG71_22665 [Streptomyces sp. NEAU-S7GS2]MCW7986694.1 hypothetical protein [Streptomyces platensis subsp. clarensis]MYT12281.1 hypothetical protein [Streptomyces sp. SID4951]WAU09665.1 DUF6153 family protein [Streptomyces nigrescens]